MPVVTIPFGPYEPDRVHLNSDTLAQADGAYPAPVGYTFAPTNTGLSTVTFTPPLTGGVVIQTAASGAYSLYYGTTNIIRRIDSSAINTVTTIATSTQPTAPALWRFAKFGTKIIAVHEGVDALYEDWTAAATAMSTLGGSPPRATGAFTIGDFLFLTGLASNKRKLRWSAINDAEGWTVGTNLCDEQEFPDGGDVLGIAGDKFGFVIQSNAIRRFQFLPGDTSTIFSFDRVQDVPGCVGLNAWVAANNSIYYYSEEGFCSIGPNGFQRIGAHRVDRSFRGSLGGTNAPYVRATADPFGTRVFFSWDSDGNGQPTGALVYDYALDRWSSRTLSTGPDSHGFLFEYLDSTGGFGPVIGTASGGIDALTVSGTATIETSIRELFPGKRATVTALRPVVRRNTSFTQTVQSRARDKLNSSTNDASSTTEETNGKYSVLSDGTYHSFSVSATDTSEQVGYLVGVQVFAEQSGEA